MNKCVISLALLASCLIGGPLCAGVFTPYDGEWKLHEIQLPAAVVNGTPSEDFEITSGDVTIADDGMASFKEFESDEEESALLMLSDWELRSLALLITSDAEEQAPLPLSPSASGNFLSYVFKDEYVVALGLAVKSPTDLTLADLEGDWVDHFFETPARIEGGNASLPFDAGVTAVSVDSAGDVLADGASIGSLSVNDGGSFTFEDDEGSILFFVNDAKDAAIASSVFEDSLALDVLTRTPESLDVSELEGHWQVIEVQAPDVSNFQGLDLDNGEFAVFSERIFVDASGVVDAGAPDDSGGVLTVNPDNTVTFSGNSEDEGGAVLSINASKDLLVLAEQTDGEVGLTLVVRLEPFGGSEADILDIVTLESGETEVHWQESDALELFVSEDFRFWSLESLLPGQTSAPLVPSDSPHIFYKAYREE